MSIGSIGSIRGALSSVEAQASLNSPRVNVRSAEEKAPEGVSAVPVSGSGFAASGQPWAAWPPYLPPPPVDGGDAADKPTVPAIPLPSDTREGEFVVKPQPPAAREGLVLESLPLPRPTGNPGVTPLPVPVPRPPVEDQPVVAPLPPPGDPGGSEGLTAAPLPPPGRPVTPGSPANPGAPVVPAIPLPIEASGFATPSPLVPFESDRTRGR